MIVQISWLITDISSGNGTWLVAKARFGVMQNPVPERTLSHDLGGLELRWEMEILKNQVDIWNPSSQGI